MPEVTATVEYTLDVPQEVLDNAAALGQLQTDFDADLTEPSVTVTVEADEDDDEDAGDEDFDISSSFSSTSWQLTHAPYTSF